MSEAMLMTLYVKITNKIDQMTMHAQEGRKINRSQYNLMHQLKYQIMVMQMDKGVLF